ncbi:MAG: phosphate ABC transporter permease PstA [Phycisphaeraceae bacterium]|nr:phosphate ABC transporter permease PstA [Phycisphaeraceae bacterium]
MSRNPTPAPSSPRRRRGSSLPAYGEPMVWLTGGALALCLLMVLALIGYIVWQGAATFWPSGIVRVTTHADRILMGEVFRTQEYEVRVDGLSGMHPIAQLRAEERLLPEVRARIQTTTLPSEELRRHILSIIDRNDEAVIDRTLREVLPATFSELTADRAPAILDEALRKLTEARRTAADLIDSGRLEALDQIIEAAGDESQDSAMDRVMRLRDQLADFRVTLAQRISQARPLVAAAIREASGIEARSREDFENVEDYRLHRRLISDRELEVRAAIDLMFDNVRVPFQRRLIRTGNYDITQIHFEWVSDLDIRHQDYPEWAFLAERLRNGRFYGMPEAFSLLHYTGPAQDPEPDAGLSIDELDEFFARQAQLRRARAREIADSLRPEIEQRNARLPEGQRIELRYVSGNNWLRESELTEHTRIEAVAEYHITAPLAWAQFETHHQSVRDRWQERRRLETHDNGRVARRLELGRLRVLRHAMRHEVSEAWINITREIWQLQDAGDEEAMAQRLALREEIEEEFERPPAAFLEIVAEYEDIRRQANLEFERIAKEIEKVNRENDRYVLHAVTAQGVQRNLTLNEIVRAYTANQTRQGDNLRVYLSRWWEFISDDPREANSEGGVFPAIFGTVLMTLIMSIAVVPFGVLAALYLREYAKPGPLVSAVRIAINNLAGVPSIVFGVFGLGFFCYLVGGGIDGLFFPERESPTFNKGGLLWASLTLALLTLPVVIVATEEALAAVPGSMREGSYACGASKWQTIKRIVLPRAMPGIMTGMILAMARGAGEVAPLMLVGAAKMAPELPGRIDAVPPYIHVESSFMHLGFHIFDLGFQSQDSEAARPMVFTTTLLLIVLIVLLNITAIVIRSRLRRKFVNTGF